MNKKLATLAISPAVALTLAMMPTSSWADDEWEFGLGIYGYFPDISGNTRFPLVGGDGFEIGIDTILDNLEFTFQGNFDARKGRWGFLTDVIYLDVSKGRSNYREGSVGGSPIPAEAELSVNLNVKSLIWTNSAYYRLFEENGSRVDFLFGVRYADLEQELSWNLEGSVEDNPLPGRTGTRKVSADYFDGIVGLRGRLALGEGDKWFLPYYADIGTGDSDLTWQVAAGVGYSFGWGHMQAGWRYLAYDLPSGKPIEDLDLNGPQIGATFRW